MFTQNELSNGSNFAWLGSAFVAWLAVIWLYYRGEWRRSRDVGLRESSAMFLRGACLSLFSQWAHRGYWSGYLVLMEAGNFETLADVTAGRWIVPVIAMAGSVGNVMMLFPVLKFFLKDYWWAFGMAMLAALWILGVSIT